MKGLTIITEPRHIGATPIHVVRVSGYIDAHSFPRFEQEMLSLLNEGNYRLVLHLGEATYLCSTALGLLMNVFRQVRHNAGDLVVACMPEKLVNIFNLLGFSRLIRAFGSEEEAVQCLATPQAP